MKYIFKFIVDDKDEFYLRDLNGEVTKNKEESFVLTDKDKIWDIYSIMENSDFYNQCLDHTGIELMCEKIYDDDYHCILQIIEEGTNDGEDWTKTKTRDLYKEDLYNEYSSNNEEDYISVEEYCSGIIEEYKDDWGGVESLTIRYSEDDGNNWTCVCRNL